MMYVPITDASPSLNNIPGITGNTSNPLANKLPIGSTLLAQWTTPWLAAWNPYVLHWQSEAVREENV